MPINLLDVKNKKVKLKQIDDNNQQLNQTVNAPMNRENNNRINLADVKSGKIKMTPIENDASKYNLDGTRRIPLAMSITNDNILKKGRQNLLNNTIKQSLTDMLIKGQNKEEQIDLSGKSYLKDTGKTYGELNPNASQYKDNIAYYNVKNGKYYINDNGKYIEGNATPTNINTMSAAPTNEGDKLLKELSKKTGYTEEEVKGFIDDYNNARWDNTKAKYKVAGDKFKNAGMEVFKAAKEYDKYRPTTDKKLSVMENTIKSTGNALIETGKGVVDFSEGILDTGLQLGSSKYNPGMWIATGQTPWSKDQTKLNQYQDTAKEIIQKDASENFVGNTLGYNKKLSDGRTIQETLDSGATINSKNLGGQIFRGIGAQIPGLMTGSEGQSLALMGINSFGSGVEQAYSNNATRNEATTYGLLNAGIETATEKMFAGIGGVLGKGTLDDAVKKSIEKKISNQILKKLVDFGLDSIGEGTEEVIGDLLQPIAQKLTYAKEEDLLKLYKDQNFLEDFISGTLSSAIMQGMTLPSKKAMLNQNNTQNEENTHQFKELLKNSINNTTDIENGKIEPKIAYQYESTDNSKINNLRKSASKYFNNSEQTHNFIDNISKIISDKNYNVVFDDTISNNKGQLVNAQIKTLNNSEIEIKINPNSPKAGEFLIIHEVTHAIETKEMKKLVLDYASQHDDFNQALNDLKATYGTDDVSSEVIADISGQLFGNQEFINNLSLEKPNIFKRIYNSIISLANKITGNSHEALFIKDLKNKWETAYRNITEEQTMNNLNNNASFSIQQDSNGNNYVNVDVDQDIFDGKSLLEQTKIAKKYILDNFRKNGLIIDDSNVNVTSRTANEYTHSKTKISKDVASSKMKASTELNNLLSIAEYSHSNADDGRHNIAKDGWDYYKVNFRVGNNNFEGLINIAKNGNQKTLYDITRIKKTSRVGSDNKSTTTNAMSSYGNNITQSKDNVKLPTKYSMQNNQNNTLLKQQQLDIILNSNPAGNETATWIRKIDDIKTFEETLQDSDWEGWEDSGFDPDYTADMVREALDTGKIKVYSSYPIEQGIFVTPSKMEAESYSGTGKVYSKEISLEDVAWIDPTQGQYAKVEGKYSQNTGKWQEYLDKHYKPTGTRTNINDIKIPIAKNINKISIPLVETKQTNSKILNPNEISKLTPEDANTTPKLPIRNRNKIGDGESNFFNNIKDKTNMLNDEQKSKILSSDEVKYYDKVTNKESLDKAFDRLNDGGESEALKWFNKDSNNADATDVAEGWILMKQYADNNDYDGMVGIAKKMRDIGSKAGQTVQAFNIMERMTPEGMVKYAQSELQEAYDKMVKNKTRKWIDEHRSDFDLTPEEVQFIMDNMKEISTMEDGYDKRVKLAEIQKLMTDKLPQEKGTGIKSWMRISMLFNPKTQVRNVLGNAVIAPINYFGDLFSSYADKVIAKKTGVRTTGRMNIKAILNGMKQGAYQSTNDYKKGINTRNMEGNRFEIGEGKSFNDKNIIGRNLNRVDHLLNYVMDAGDRIFSQASFENSLQNQMILNNTTEITQDMIDIANKEALQRTWNDNNNYTQFVLDVRRGMNKIGFKGYGLGDILIPFAKTPANLTKAIVDYSPLGLVNTLIEGNNLKKSLTNGQYNPKMQHQFVQDLGKATAGSMLYILGYALAKMGITTGESDKDKDVANFLKNTLGVNSYSIKIGNKSFTYDWAQPLAAPLSITANIVNKQKQNSSLKDSILSSLDTAGNILLEQSFLDSLNTVFSNNDGIATGIEESIMELPSRAIPTFMKQIADMVDGTQRQTFESDKPLDTAVNKIKAKIPFVSRTLEPSVDTMGNEIKKYGGRNDLFNVFLNPANFNKENKSKSAEEIYNVYKKTGDKTIFPRVAPYSIDKKGLTTKQRSEYQKISGNIVEKEIQELLKNKEYKNLSNEDKSVIINNIVGYAANKAKSKILNTEMSKSWNSVNNYIKNGGTIHQFYLNKVVKQ